MKGVILAGGSGSRLYPLTKSVNKHLLPVHEKPMLQHCVEKLTEINIKDILVVTGGEHLGGIAEFLESGREFNCRITYRVQEEAGGIAQALSLAEGFVSREESMCVLLGDNMFEDDLSTLMRRNNFDISPHDGMVVLKEVEDPERFGVAVLEQSNPDMFLRLSGIEEKPKNPKSNMAVTGIYFYRGDVFDVIRCLKPSERGELEITDVNNHYIKRGTMDWYPLEGWWTDAGTHESLAKANELMRESSK